MFRFNIGKMELDILEVIEDELAPHQSNASLPYSSYDFIENNKSIAILYLTFISGLTVIGTFGNMLVLGTLLIVKVSSYVCEHREHSYQYLLETYSI